MIFHRCTKELACTCTPKCLEIYLQLLIWKTESYSCNNLLFLGGKGGEENPIIFRYIEKMLSIIWSICLWETTGIDVFFQIPLIFSLRIFITSNFGGSYHSCCTLILVLYTNNILLCLLLLAKQFHLVLKEQQIGDIPLHS